MALQQQVGNLAVQRLLAQRQAGEQQNVTRTPVDVGRVKIEKPRIEYYEVTGGSLPEACSQVLPPEQWYQYEYRYTPKVENGKVTRVDVIVTVTVQLPRWVGPGWEHAPDADKVEWLAMLQALHIDPDDSYDDITRLPPQWLLGPNWEQAPDAVKGTWRAMLQALQIQEQGPVEIARRHAMVLQQRLLNQPEAQVRTIFDQFMKDLKIEQEAYSRQTEFGLEQKISLDIEIIVQ